MGFDSRSKKCVLGIAGEDGERCCITLCSEDKVDTRIELLC